MGKWIQRAPMPTPRHDLQAITVGKRIYAISGGGDLTSDVIEIYDVQNDSWSKGPSMLTKRGWFGAVRLDKKIYVVGGKTVTTQEQRKQSPAHYQILDSLEVLDLSSQTWSTLEPMSRERAGLVATVCKGRIYTLGGNTMNNETRDGGDHLNRVEVYDPSSGQWSMGVPMPVDVQGPVIATVDDKIYVTAGIGGPEGIPNSKTYVFDPETGRWDGLAPIPTPRCDPGTVVIGRRIYTFGGWGRSALGRPAYYHDCVESYDIDADTWSSGTPMPVKKAWMAAASVEHRIFVMGGAYKLENADGFAWLGEVHEFIQ